MQVYTDPEAKQFALDVMQYMNDKCKQWKAAENMDYSLYELVDGLALLQPGQSAMLPVDGRGIGESTDQPLMTETRDTSPTATMSTSPRRLTPSPN